MREGPPKPSGEPGKPLEVLRAMRNGDTEALRAMQEAAARQRRKNIAAQKAEEQRLLEEASAMRTLAVTEMARGITMDPDLRLSPKEAQIMAEALVLTLPAEPPVRKKRRKKKTA